MLSLVLALLLQSPAPVDARFPVGAVTHLSGCREGKLEVRVINLWEKPGVPFNQNSVLRKLSGTSNASRCTGSKVRIEETRRVNGKTYVRVDGGGWVAETLIKPAK